MVKKTVLTKADIVEMEMDLTGACNLKCPLCTRNYSHAKHLIKANARPVQDIIAQLDTFPNLEIFYVAGTISEPTLYKDLHRLCEYLVARGIAVEMYTNGNTNNEAWWARLGEILTANDRIYFTICGSNQKMHEAYRVGSSLEEILKHHQAFISTNTLKIDHIQHIMFDYNRADFETPEMKAIIARFSSIKPVETEGQRSLNEYIKSFDKAAIKPEEERERSINALFDVKPKPTDAKKYEIKCMSLRDRKIYVDQFGKISPCYGHAEFEGPGYFASENFDYSEILSFKFHDCFKCERRIQKFIEVMELDFVC
jgi:sulfatase maturation enzyme AslB (radical SAM superfamily)